MKPRIAQIQFRMRLGATCLGLALLAGSLSAQTAISPISSEPALPLTARRAAAAASSPAVSSSVLPPESPFRLGVVVLKPHVVYRYLYGNGLQSRPGNQQNTSVNTVSPGLQVDVGTNWFIDYTPSWTWYSDPSFIDTLDHSARLSGQAVHDEWLLKLSQSFSKTTSPLVETGAQTEQTQYSTAFDAAYRLGTQMQLDTALGHDVRFVSEFPDSRETSIENTFHVKLGSFLDAGPGFRLAYIDMSSGSDMTTLRPHVQVNWTPTESLTLTARGGVEKRAFKDSDRDDLNSPVASVTIDYRPLEFTRIAIDGSKDVSASYFEDQITRTEAVSASLNQRLLGHLFLTATYRRTKSKFLATTTTLPVDREDRRNTVDLRLSTRLFRRASVTLLYSNGHNSSNIPGFAFTTEQAGVEIAYRY